LGRIATLATHTPPLPRYASGGRNSWSLEAKSGAQTILVFIGVLRTAAFIGWLIVPKETVRHG